MQDSNIVNDQDKLMAAVAWVIPIVAIVILLVEDMKNRPFQKYHAISSLAFSAVLFVIFIVGSIIVSILAAVTFGIGGFLGCCLILPWLAVFYYAFQAYQGQWVEVPMLTDFIRNQGWV
jgi:uncharacterized membrane protein